MKPKFDLLVCATIVATHWGVTANAQLGSQGSGVFGAVYTMTNDASENSVLVYSRNSNGLLTLKVRFRLTVGVLVGSSIPSNRRDHWS